MAWPHSIQDEELRRETARAMAGVILRQTREIQDDRLRHADARILGELERQREQALLDVGDDLPRPSE
ncbi:hypothetical protein HZ994_00540 [Akkermansiaceae bacterium]|nr:hypothetical protein HZ994_00540 [Akkermansiaceae bacterium]